jgi:hypothetical protein
MRSRALVRPDDLLRRVVNVEVWIELDLLARARQDDRAPTRRRRTNRAADGCTESDGFDDIRQRVGNLVKRRTRVEAARFGNSSSTNRRVDPDDRPRARGAAQLGGKVPDHPEADDRGAFTEPDRRDHLRRRRDARELEEHCAFVGDVVGELHDRRRVLARKRRVRAFVHDAIAHVDAEHSATGRDHLADVAVARPPRELRPVFGHVEAAVLAGEDREFGAG